MRDMAKHYKIEVKASAHISFRVNTVGWAKNPLAVCKNFFQRLPITFCHFFCLHILTDEFLPLFIHEWSHRVEYFQKKNSYFQKHWLFRQIKSKSARDLPISEEWNEVIEQTLFTSMKRNQTTPAYIWKTLIKIWISIPKYTTDSNQWKDQSI